MDLDDTGQEQKPDRLTYRANQLAKILHTTCVAEVAYPVLLDRGRGKDLRRVEVGIVGVVPAAYGWGGKDLHRVENIVDVVGRRGGNVQVLALEIVDVLHVRGERDR